MWKSDVIWYWKRQQFDVYETNPRQWQDWLYCMISCCSLIHSSVSHLVYLHVPWLVMRPVLFRKWLWICLAWCNSNKRVSLVSLSFKRHGCRSLWVLHYGCYANHCRFDSHLPLLTFVFFLNFFSGLCVTFRD